MGAGGSTAVSCSSLDISNEHYKQSGRHQMVQQQLRQVQEQRMQKYNRKLPPQAANMGRGANLMKQSNSYFDLTTSHLLHLDKQQLSRQQQAKTTENGRFDTNQSETYSLSNADFSVARPIRVLPPTHPQHNSNGSKCKTNAGVAGRIQMQRQEQRAHELKKFSDSLPSLASIHPNQLMLNQTSSSNAKSNDHHHHHHHPHPHLFHANHPQQQQHKQRVCSQQSYQISAKQQILQSHVKSNQQQPSIHLVSRNDDSARPYWKANANVKHEVGGCNVNSKQQLIKRAISLSSLHNLHHHHQQPQLPMTYGEQVNSAGGDRFKKQQLVSSKAANKQVSSSAASKRLPPESMNNYLSYDLQQEQQQLCNKHHSSSNGNHHHLHQSGHQVKSQQHNNQQTHYNQPTPLAKKINKLKQFAHKGGQSSKKYKQQEEQHQQQQGCPVLPPLPRSRSLHELIQLRATENGQRMRTTGTLRGPLGGPNAEQPCNKVNLVAELLESRRQQKLNEELGGGNVAQAQQNQATLLSRSSSSSDDGIHDVSINGDQSTGDSRRHNALKNNLNNHHDSHRLSSTSENSEPSKQRVYRKNSQLAANNQRRYSQNINQQARENERDLQEGSLTRGENNQLLMNGRSNLKRSVSHSALQTNNNHDLDDEHDEDESDDLNELAKFLYQFKQRQVSAAKGNNSAKDFINSNTSQNDNERRSSNATASSAPTSAQVASNSFQQSPNSTTSSSGFASSTCTSNSISSLTSSKENRQRLSNDMLTSGIKQEHTVSNKLSEKQPGRKKYPAPPRPDEGNGKLSKGANSNKCLISGKLKLSSSLLSIVDEYNSTLQSSNGKSNAKHSPDSANITSVLLNGKKTQASYDVTTPDPSEDLSGPSSNCSQDCHQLEQLKRYTQLRQMSQSQLALNHLTSSSTSSSKGNSSNKAGKHDNGKPYKSKLINLIRRVGDKSAVAYSGQAAGVRLRESGSAGGRLENRNKTNGGSQQKELNHLRAINQTELIVPYSKQDVRQEKYYEHKARNDEAQIRQNDDASIYTGEVEIKPARLGGKGGGCLSESLCDLNFDCDFELIKNCGSANEPKGQAVVGGKGGGGLAIQRQQQQPLKAEQLQQHKTRGGSSLLASQVVGSQASDATEATDRQARRREKELAKKHQQEKQQQQHQAVINSSKGENNWRLGPSSLSLAKPLVQLVANSDCANKNAASKQQQQLNQSMEGESGKKASGRQIVSKVQSVPSTNMDRSASEKQQQQRKQPVKLKWSAGGWLMNGSGSKNKKQPAEQAAVASSSGKNRLSKLISSSRTPSLPVAGSGNGGNAGHFNHDDAVVSDSANGVGVVGPVLDESALGNFANVNNEANQLLYELDHSLDLVSADLSAPFSRKTALSWWKTDEQGGNFEKSSRQRRETSLRRDGTGLGLLSDSDEDGYHDHDEDLDDYDDHDDDDDSGDYASLNRAMINATFDADTIIQQHELQQLQERNSGNKINMNAELSIEPGSPSDSFTFSAPSSPVQRSGGETFAPVDNGKQTIVSGQDHHPHDSGRHLHQRQELCDDEQCLGKQQAMICHEVAATTTTPKQDGNISEVNLELKGSSQIRKFMCSSNHVISNLSTTSPVLVSQPTDSSGCSPASEQQKQHQHQHQQQALLASKRQAGCNLDSKRIVSYTSKQQVGQDKNDGQLKAEDANMMVGDRLGLVPIAANGASRRIHEPSCKQQQLVDDRLSNAACCLVESTMLDCAEFKQVGANDLVGQSKLMEIGRTHYDGSGGGGNSNNNIDCRCCQPLDTGHPLKEAAVAFAGEREPTNLALKATTTTDITSIGQSNIPRRLNGKSNGLALSKCQSSSVVQNCSSASEVLNCVDGQKHRLRQVASAEQEHCDCFQESHRDSSDCCRRLHQNRSQALGVGVKFEGLNEQQIKSIELKSAAEMTKTPTKTVLPTSQLQKATTGKATVSNGADMPNGGAFCSVQGQLDELGQSFCACCTSRPQVARIEAQCCANLSEVEKKNADRNMNAYQRASQCDAVVGGHYVMQNSSCNGSGCNGGAPCNNGRQTTKVEDNLAELKAHNCHIPNGYNKCRFPVAAATAAQDELAKRKAFMCQHLHDNGSKTYCRNKQTGATAVAAAVNLVAAANGRVDEPENNKLIIQQTKTSCHCSNSASPNESPDASKANKSSGDDIIINGSSSSNGSRGAVLHSCQLTPPTSGPLKLPESAGSGSGEGCFLADALSCNNCKSSNSSSHYHYCEKGKSLLPPSPPDCSQLSSGGDQLNKIGSGNGISQQPQQTKSIACNKLKHQLPATNNCFVHCCNKSIAAICDQDEQTARCKVAACHYPSSKLLSQTNYGEDVKCAQAFVSGDNLISKTGQKLENNVVESEVEMAAEANDSLALVTGETSSDNSSAAVVLISAGAAASSASALANCCSSPAHKMGHDNCRCNNWRRVNADQQQQLSHEKDGKLIKRFNAALARFGAHPVNCIGQQERLESGRQLNKATKAISARPPPSQQTVGQHNNPICRSNSELTSNKNGIKQVGSKLAARQATPLSNAGQNPNHHNNLRQQQQQQQLEQLNKEQLLSGKLRSSLLNRKQEAHSQMSKGSKLSSSQLSLFSYYNDNHFVVSPFVGGRSDLSSTSSNNQLNADFDDNFILKRKTPNAGLKSRC